jgi:hypothetical protein
LLVLGFWGIKIKELPLDLGFGDQMKRTMSFGLFQKPHHWVSCTKKNQWLSLSFFKRLQNHAYVSKPGT